MKKRNIPRIFACACPFNEKKKKKNIFSILIHTCLMWPRMSPLPLRLIRVNMTLLLIDSSSFGDWSCVGAGTTNNGSKRITYAVICNETKKQSG